MQEKYSSKYQMVSGKRLEEILDSPIIKEYKDKIAGLALKNQSKLFELVDGHPIARGTITWIRYNNEDYGVTNAHCLPEGSNPENYRAYLPSLKTKEYEEDQKITLDLELVHRDKAVDLAAFKVDRRPFKASKRSFIELSSFSSNDLDKSDQVLFVGVPGERLGFYYRPDDPDYTQFERILNNHITIFSVIEQTTEEHHVIPVTEQYNVIGITNKRSENDSLFTEEELWSGKVGSIKGMSGSPCFTFSFRKLPKSDLRFLGILYAGTPQSGKVNVLKLDTVKKFLTEANDKRQTKTRS